MAAKQGEPIDSDDVIFSFAFTLIKLNSEFSILNKNAVCVCVSLSLYFAIQFVHYCPLFPISSHTLQEMTMTCFFKLRKVAAAGRKLFALIFLFLSSPYVKLSDFFLFVSPIALLHTIFIRMISVLVLLFFLQYLPSILTRISKTPQDFWWETGDLVNYFILLVDAVKNAREANLLVVGLVDWRALVLSLKEALTQP